MVGQGTVSAHWAPPRVTSHESRVESRVLPRLFRGLEPESHSDAECHSRAESTKLKAVKVCSVLEVRYIGVRRTHSLSLPSWPKLAKAEQVPAFSLKGKPN